MTKRATITMALSFFDQNPARLHINHKTLMFTKYR